MLFEAKLLPYKESASKWRAIPSSIPILIMSYSFLCFLFLILYFPLMGEKLVATAWAQRQWISKYDMRCDVWLNVHFGATISKIAGEFMTKIVTLSALGGALYYRQAPFFNNQSCMFTPASWSMLKTSNGQFQHDDASGAANAMAIVFNPQNQRQNDDYPLYMDIGTN